MTLNRRFAIALGVTALLGTAVAQAEQLRKAEVPFAFQVSGHKLDAGTYQAARSLGGEVMLRDSAGHTVYIMPVPGDKMFTDESSLSFRCYGSNCYLSEIRFGSTQTAYQVRPTKAEKELAKVEEPRVTLVAMR